MTATFACSVCHHQIEPGSQRCPGCGLQLIAQPVRVVETERPRYSFWAVMIGSLGLAILAIFIADHLRPAATDADILADLQAGRITSAEAFQARCGAAQWTRGDELHYFTNGQDLYVAFPGPHYELEHTSVEAGRARTWRSPIDPRQAISTLHCK